MGYLSIRNLPARLEQKIMAEARRRHMTKTAVVIECLEKALRPEARLPVEESDGLTFSQRWAGCLRGIDRDDARAQYLEAKYAVKSP